MIIQTDFCKYIIKNNVWILNTKYEDISVSFILNPLLDSPTLDFLRQHQTFALLNPEE